MRRGHARRPGSRQNKRQERQQQSDRGEKFLHGENGEAATLPHSPWESMKNLRLMPGPPDYAEKTRSSAARITALSGDTPSQYSIFRAP